VYLILRRRFRIVNKS